MPHPRSDLQWLAVAVDSSVLVGTFLAHSLLFREVSSDGAALEPGQLLCLASAAFSLAAFFFCLSAPTAYTPWRPRILFVSRLLKLLAFLQLARTTTPTISGPLAATSTALALLLSLAPLHHTPEAAHPSPPAAPPRRRGLSPQAADLLPCAANAVLLAATLALSDHLPPAPGPDTALRWVCRAMNRTMHAIEVGLLCIPQDARYFAAACTTRPAWLLITFLELYLGTALPALLSARLHYLLARRAAHRTRQLQREQGAAVPAAGLNADAAADGDAAAALAVHSAAHGADGGKAAAAEAAAAAGGSSPTAALHVGGPAAAAADGSRRKAAYQQLRDLCGVGLVAVLLWVASVHLHMVLKGLPDSLPPAADSAVAAAAAVASPLVSPAAAM